MRSRLRDYQFHVIVSRKGKRSHDFVTASNFGTRLKTRHRAVPPDGLTRRRRRRKTAAMLPSSTWVIAEAFAGLQAQGLGLTDAAGLAAEVRPIAPRGVWRHVP